jgi:hypothetical protein
MMSSLLSGWVGPAWWGSPSWVATALHRLLLYRGQKRQKE